MTVRSAVAVKVPLLALIVAIPVCDPVTCPVVSTVATNEFVVVQVDVLDTS